VKFQVEVALLFLGRMAGEAEFVDDGFDIAEGDFCAGECAAQEDGQQRAYERSFELRATS
jgi:hypothetical protein